MGTPIVYLWRMLLAGFYIFVFLANCSKSNEMQLTFHKIVYK